MPIEERVVWVYVVVTVAVAAMYAAVIGGRLADTPPDQVAYEGPMIFAFAAIVLLTVVGTILSAIGAAARAQITRPGASADVGRTDERDRQITWRGDRVGYQVTSTLAVGALALTLAGAPHFWIANSLFGAFVVGGLAGAAVKLAVRHRG